MLFGIVAGSASILVTWLILILALLGIGLLARRAFSLAMTTEGLFGSFWLGLALTVLVLQLWHLVLPITAITLAVFLAVGFAGLVLSRTELKAWWTPAWRRVSPVLLVVTALGVFWLANRSMDTVAAGDTGMYHYPMVLWAKEYPIVPGLANLHGRLGFNGSGLLFAALADVGPWAGRSTHVVNGLFLAVLLASILFRLAPYLRSGSRPHASSVFDLVLLTPLMITALDPWYISSFTTDLPVAVILFVATSRLLRLLSTPSESRDARESAFEVVLITSLCTVAVCFKLSAAIFGGVLWLIAAVWFIRAHRTERPWFGRGLKWTVALTAGLGIVWVARGVILSGFPFYPSTVLPAPVDWRVPLEQAEAEAAWIGHFARTFYSGEIYNSARFGDRLLTDWTWFKPWLSGALKLVTVRWLLVMPLVLAAGFLLFGFFQKSKRTASAARLLLLPTLAGMGFWFLAGPRPPFGFFAFWILAGLCAAIGLGGLVETASAGRLRLVGAVAIAIASLPAIVPMVALLRSGSGASLGALAKVVIVPSGPDHWMRPMPGQEEARGQRAVMEYKTASGLVLLTPRQTNRCWFASVLCTPHPSPNIRLRKPDHIESGFVIDGAWQPARWPNPQTGFLESWRAYRQGRTLPQPPQARAP